MSFTKKPDRISALKRYLEIIGIILNSEDYISSDKIIQTYSQINTDSLLDESGIKRAISGIHEFLEYEIIESKPSRGYRFRQEFSQRHEILLPLFSQYLFISELDSLNYVLEPIPFQLDKKSLHFLYLLVLKTITNP